MRIVALIVISLIILGCESNSTSSHWRINISDSEILEEFLISLQERGISYEDRAEGAFVLRTDWPKVLNVVKERAHVLLPPDRSSMFSNFVKEELEKTLDSKGIAYSNVCFFGFVYTTWAVENSLLISKSLEEVEAEIHEIWKRTPKEEWPSAIDDSQVKCT